MNCQFCETQPAEVVRYDIELAYDEDAVETATEVARHICRTCEDLYYDEPAAV